MQKGRRMTRPAPMRRFAAILFLLGFLFIGGKSVRAQYYSWGADAAALRWKHLRTEDVRVVFPDTASALAHRTLYYIQAVRPTITHGFSHPPLKIPFVLHTENFQSNGLVMWMPKRIEFLTTPSVDSYSMPWVKQLVAHEYRHAVQYNNLNRGLIRILSYLIGQQGSTVGLLFMPLWALEGDAVMNETEMSSYGRGRQPRFTIEYRALGYEVLRRRNCDKWFCGSFRDFVPDHYQMGYQMVAYGYDRYGDGIWDKTLRYGVRNAYMLTFSTSVALRKFYGTGEGILFRDAFADLNRFWDSLPKVTDSGRTLTPLPEKNYTTYTHPVSLNDTTLVALKTDFDRPSRLVAVDSRTGRERRRTWTGLVSSRPTTDGQRVWWTEYRRSLLFPERVNSRLVVLAPGKKRPRNAPKLRNVLYPTPIGRSGALAWVEYTPDGHYTIVAEDSLRQRTAWPMPGFSEVHGLAWDNATERLYTLVTDNSGMWIGRIEPGEGLQAVTRGAYITLSDCGPPTASSTTARSPRAAMKPTASTSAKGANTVFRLRPTAASPRLPPTAEPSGRPPTTERATASPVRKTSNRFRSPRRNCPSIWSIRPAAAGTWSISTRYAIPPPTRPPCTANIRHAATARDCTCSGRTAGPPYRSTRSRPSKSSTPGSCGAPPFSPKICCRAPKPSHRGAGAGPTAMC